MTTPAEAFLDLSMSVLRDLVAGQSPRDLAERVCLRVEQMCPGKIASIMWAEGGGEKLYVFAAPSVPQGLIEALNGLTPGAQAGSCGHAAHGGEPALVCDIDTDARWDDLRPIAQQWQLRSCWSYPVFHNDHLLGTFALSAMTSATPTEEDILLLEFAATLVGALLHHANQAVERQRLTDQKNRLIDFHHMLAKVSQKIASAENEQELFQPLCDLAVRYAHLKLVMLARPDDTLKFRFLAASGATGFIDDLFVSADPNLPEGLGTMGRTWREGCDHFNTSFEKTEFLRPWQARAQQFGLKSTATLPVLRGGKIFAVLAVYHAEPDVFDGPLQDVLRELALSISRGLDRLDARKLQNALFNNALVGVFLVKDRVVKSCNPQAAHMFGYTLDEMAGMPVRDFFVSDIEYARLDKVFSKMTKSHAVQRQSVACVRRDGRVVTCDVSGRLFTDNEGIHSVWTVLDATEREAQAQRLHRIAGFRELLAELNQFSANPATMQHVTDHDLYKFVCGALSKNNALKLAWIGSPQQNGSDFNVLATSGEVNWHSECLSIQGEQPLSSSQLGKEHPAQRCWRENQTLFLSYERPSTDDSGGGPVARSIVSLPIRIGGALSTVLTVCGHSEDVLDQDAISFFENLVLSIERGLQNIRQRNQIMRLQGLYRALMQQADVVLRAQTVPDMLVGTCEKLVHETPFNAIYLRKPNADGVMDVLASTGSGAEELPGVISVVAESARDQLIVRAWLTQKTAIENDLLGNVRLDGYHSFLRAHRWHSALVTPVRRGGEMWAVMGFVSEEHDVFDPQTVELCERVAELLGRGLDELDNKQRLVTLQSEEAYRARHDRLTDLPNRFALEHYLPQALARARNDGRVLVLGMMDLDDFKPVNDQFGHETGDRLLRELAGRLRSRLRAQDFLVRLGGDEFVVVIGDIDPDHVITHLQLALSRLHEAVEEGFQVAPDRLATVGLSGGFALYPQDGKDGDTLLRKADATMYRSKTRKSTRDQWWQLFVQEEGV
ncbi:GAF domain-containing protein [Halothiobacillus sp.]|uniref:sensor domain-containing diguanylate cyclase n=1 Tax=Halothiobacillus sp. TaxID=1891311 RepID=UPI0026079911|nr:GAF domain-containing protein [Halothiobacillus sp.]